MKKRWRLSIREIERYRNQGNGIQTENHIRYFCPIHGGDNQRSLSVNPKTGRFKCFACGAWGYFKDKHSKTRGGDSGAKTVREVPQPLSDELQEVILLLHEYLAGSLGEKYLNQRGISLEIAQEYGIGYAPDGEWPHIGKGEYFIRQWKTGRLVFPHTDPTNQVVNLYGRAVDIGCIAPKEKRHDHLPGLKGVFNGPALKRDTVYICEGAFDALSLIAAGYEDSCAIFGVDGIRWEWVRANHLIFCMDPDQGGSRWRALAERGVLLGKKVHFLPKSFYAGYEDLNALWTARSLINIE